jgi:hypothetical protein
LIAKVYIVRTHPFQIETGQPFRIIIIMMMMMIIMIIIITIIITIIMMIIIIIIKIIIIGGGRGMQIHRKCETELVANGKYSIA